MGWIYTIANYIKYRINAINEHKIHSPFIFELTTDILYDKNKFYAFDDIDSIRSKLLLSTQKIKINDLGARKNHYKTRSISSIAKTSSIQKPYGEMLFKLVNKFKPCTSLELGTNLGISSMYLAAGYKKGKLITIEGCPELCKIAQINFNKLGLNNIELIQGNFDDKLPVILKKINTLDFVFFDGNHKKEATLNYFNLCLEKINNDTIFVFDDIYWSKEMTEAWKFIKNQPEVTCSLDLFRMGIVFFKKELTKQHFIIKF